MDAAKCLWYHPHISRVDCESLLNEHPSGAYLVRNSESSKDHVLSIRAEPCKHIKIRRNENGFYLAADTNVQRVFFRECGDLIDFYKQPNRGLVYTLNYPVLRTNTQYDGSDSSSDEGDESEEAVITKFFQQQLTTLKSLHGDAGVDEEFDSMIEDYVDHGVNRDFMKLRRGATKPVFIQQLLVKAAKHLKQCLSQYVKRLDRIQELFDLGTATNKKGFRDYAEIDEVNNADDLESLLNALKVCNSSIIGLEEKACKVLKEYSASFEGSIQSSAKDELYSSIEFFNKEAQKDTGKTFEVTSGALKTKSTITLAVKEGNIKFCKNTEEFVTYPLEKVLQLVKSKNSKTKLGILIANNMKNFVFANCKSREYFCQTVQQMKLAHSDNQETDHLSLFVGTWNMGDAEAPEDIGSWLKCGGQGKTHSQELPPVSYDLYALGTQESAYHEKEWIKKIRSELKKMFPTTEYSVVRCATLWGMRILIVVKTKHMHFISKVKHSSVKTGIANTLGNKGAVGVSFNFGSTSLCFVNCHLTSGNEKLQRRNQNYRDIIRGLQLGQKEGFDLTLSFHHLFWFGDLNYRIDLNIELIIKGIMQRDWSKLIMQDQLSKQMRNGDAFSGFEEEELMFPPTYRYTRGERINYCYMKGTRTNVPSYCDRVLYRSYPELVIENTTYGCPDDICTSDHSPVYAGFNVELLSVGMSKPKDTTIDPHEQVKLVFFSASAKVMTSLTKVVLEFYSNCFDDIIRSRVNSMSDSRKRNESLFRAGGPTLSDNFAYPWWAKDDLPELIPVLADSEYLMTQYIQVAVKGQDGQESYGECVHALKPFMTGEIQEFQCPLMHHGCETGYIKFKLQMKVPKSFNFKYTPSKKLHSYAIISVDDIDSLQGPAGWDYGKLTFEGDRLSIDTKRADTKEKRKSSADETSSSESSSSKENLRVNHRHLDEPPPPPVPRESVPRNSTFFVDASEIADDTSKQDRAGKSFNSVSKEPCPRPIPRKSIKLNNNLGFQLPRQKTSSQQIEFMGSDPASADDDLPPLPLPRTKKMPCSPTRPEMYRWLQRFGCHLYYDMLVEHGYDELKYLHLIKHAHELQEIGVENEQHQKEMLDEIVKLSMLDEIAAL